MRNDVPAAIPLIGVICGLAAGPLLVNPRAVLIALGLLVFVRATRRAAAFAALGVLLALRLSSVQQREQSAAAAFDSDRFVVVEAPLERDWSPRDGSSMLRCSRFVANGLPFDTPISIYARFEPREVVMEAAIRAEGFLRANERGEYTLTVKSDELMSYAGQLPAWHPAAWNRALANRLERHAGRYPVEVALAQALALGRGERLTDDIREDFRRGGTYHLLVFSGLQIAFAAGLLAALLRAVHAPRASDWLLLAFSTVAPLFIGPTPSVSRASVGIALYALSRILRRPTSLENLWCVAALVRLIAEPRDLTSVSFHLTYAGAGALLFVGRHLFERRWIGHAVAAELAIAPLTLFHFRQYVIGGSVVTLAMSPLILAMLVVSALACAAPRFLPAIGMLHSLCKRMNAAGMAGWFTAPPLAVMLFACAGALGSIAFLRERRRAAGIALVLIAPVATAVAMHLSRRTVTDPRVTFFDVGQGDAIALRSGSRAILVDGGPREAVLPLLADAGITRLEAVVLTHAHPDHCGALPLVVSELRVGTVWVNPRRLRSECTARLLGAAAAAGVPVRTLADGQRLTLGEFTIDAHVADRSFRRAAENNASIVLRASARSRTLLLTGDIEREAELFFEDRHLASDILKVAHHGSRSSTSPAALEWLAPRLAVISCGRRNLFGHPHPAVLAALEERRIRVWRTDVHGTVDVHLRPHALYVTSGSR